MALVNHRRDLRRAFEGAHLLLTCNGGRGALVDELIYYLRMKAMI